MTTAEAAAQTTLFQEAEAFIDERAASLLTNPHDIVDLGDAQSKVDVVQKFYAIIARDRAIIDMAHKRPDLFKALYDY